MRSFEEVIDFLVEKEINLRVEDGRLKYNAPSGVMNNEILEVLKEYKAPLLDYLKNNNSDRITKYPKMDYPPLSYAQSRLWFLDKLEEASFAYNLPFPVRIEGNLNDKALEESLKYVLNRHCILRTSFPENEGKPFQKVNEIGNHIIDEVDAVGNSINEKEEWTRDFITEQVRMPFDLSQGPLYNLKLIRLDDNLNVLLMIFHHIVLDGWGIDLMLNEIGICYQAFSGGKELNLPELDIQYVDYSIWHNEWMNSNQAESQLNYWKEELSQAPSLLQLPLVKPRPAVQTLNGATECFEVDSQLLNSLKELARINECSLFMVLFAAFNVLLYRYSHQDDILIGTTIANRNRAETEDLIGLFANTIVLRSDLSGDPTFSEFLLQVKTKALTAYANQDIPFEKVVEEVKPERSLSHTPLFQILFELQDISSKGNNYFSGLKMTSMEPENISAKFDMNLLFLISNEKLLGNLEYNCDLFDKEYIQRFVAHYINLLKTIVGNPQIRIDELQYISKEELEQVNRWNNTHENFPLHASYDELFVGIVRKYPDKIAAVEGEINLTYDELNKRAELLASELQANGAGPERVVAILADRSARFLVSILAVFKCGAAYLPLDTRHPTNRHIKILDQAKPLIIITESRYLEKTDAAIKGLQKNSIMKVVTDDILNRDLQGTFPISNPDVTPDNLSYIIFTSGSTGTPKGAMVIQKGMINHLYSKIRDLDINENDCIAQNASQCFDISVWQFLAALLVGGKVEIFPDDIAHDAEALIKQVDRNGITILEVVPSFMAVMTDMLEARSGYKFAQLRWLVPTGEALPPELALKWLDYFPNVPLINAYGPTECSDDVTHYPIYEKSDVHESSVPIGKPIANTRIIILDKNKRLVPIGVTGELYVAGDCVGRGYINDEVKTRSAFVENPFRKGETIYKSGDLARYLPDGNIEFLGRIDTQVKVRGFRIELGEIETELRKFDKIKSAVAIISKSGKDILAYVTIETPGMTDEKEIKEYLLNKLPEYMIPAQVLILDEFPLTPNGKINRKELPEPEIKIGNGSLALPETATEKAVSKIWQELMQIGIVGNDQNFFDIGGHSLLATRLVTRLRDSFSVEIPLKTIFEKPTVKQLAEHIDNLNWLKSSSSAVDDNETEDIII